MVAADIVPIELTTWECLKIGNQARIPSLDCFTRDFSHLNGDQRHYGLAVTSDCHEFASGYIGNKIEQTGLGIFQTHRYHGASQSDR